MNQITDCIKPLLALIVILGTFGYFFIVLFSDHKSDPQIIIAIVAVQQIPLNYYFGNSSGAAKKDETISDLSKSNLN